MRTLLGSGYFSWNAVERRTDRYGSVRLKAQNEGEDVLLEAALDALEGAYGRLVAEVVEPVRSLHIGDIARGLYPSLPAQGEVVVLGEGDLFIEHVGRDPHEQSDIERFDDKAKQAMADMFRSVGITVLDDTDQEVEVYDLVGLKPLDGRETDWLNPPAFYRLHMSKIDLYFEPKDRP